MTMAYKITGKSVNFAMAGGQGNASMPNEWRLFGVRSDRCSLDIYSKMNPKISQKLMKFCEDNDIQIQFRVVKTLRLISAVEIRAQSICGLQCFYFRFPVMVGEGIVRSFLKEAIQVLTENMTPLGLCASVINS
jgi:hypothetical protein